MPKGIASSAVAQKEEDILYCTALYLIGREEILMKRDKVVNLSPRGTGTVKQDIVLPLLRSPEGGKPLIEEDEQAYRGGVQVLYDDTSCQ